MPVLLSRGCAHSMLISLFASLQLVEREKKAAEKAARVAQQKARLAEEEEARKQIEFEKAEKKRKQVEAALAAAS